MFSGKLFHNELFDLFYDSMSYFYSYFVEKNYYALIFNYFFFLAGV